ncbi:hypothetical protein ANCCAN_04272 [Ancylostoma caninum]|uniref:Uncharacterized protein n=1 Tax=Ancylostoma caninum TaxID=29170 RepID=A0A368H1K4_ANCCA|nr:hypothetical protein ANCCAN_04272 [Ancylostoma caninum]
MKAFFNRGSYRSRIRRRDKHPAKVHVWGGTTDLAILPGNTRINSDVYCNILRKRRTVRTIPELKIARRDYWKSLTVATCQNYIKGIQWKL